MTLQVGPYRIDEPEAIESPGLIIFADRLNANIERMIEIARSPERLRPHCKTHKTREVIQRLLDRGVTRHKCATIAEAEMLLELGVEDVFLAYQPVGPNVRRAAQLAARYPRARLSVAIDDSRPLDQLADALADGDATIGVWLELDSGMHRTGIELGPAAESLYESICATPHIEPRGFHWYDGHVRQTDLDERRAVCLAAWESLIAFRNRVMVEGLPVPAIVAAGTGSFPILAAIDEPGLELSPGTVAFYDAGYQSQFPDLPFSPALAILTRVISANRAGYVTLDLGHKACAADPPAGKRLAFPAWPDAEEMQQSEEHLVVKTRFADQLRVGDCTLAIPVHACPTSAAYDRATVIEDGRQIGTWEIYARGRKITI